jgi:hypothetical protein
MDAVVSNPFHLNGLNFFSNPTPSKVSESASTEPQPEEKLVTTQGLPLEKLIPLDRKEMALRYTNDVGVHLIANDMPALLDVAAHLVPLPPFLAPVIRIADTLNVVTDLCTFGADGREIAGTLRNKKATKLDRFMDLLHFGVGDLVPLAGTFIPFVASLTNPITLGIWLASQAAGIVMDVVKTGYDIHRKGQQSAHKA